MEKALRNGHLESAIWAIWHYQHLKHVFIMT